MKLEEALKVKKIKYSGTRPEYDIHDKIPNVLVIDDHYNVDGNGDSILGINLNYLDEMPKKDLLTLLTQINQDDNKILGIGPLKAWLRSTFGYGDYNLTKEQKINRYETIIKKYPMLKKAIRRYKYSGIKRKSDKRKKEK